MRTADIPRRHKNPPLQLQRRPGAGQVDRRRWGLAFSRCRSTIGRCWARSGPDVGAGEGVMAIEGDMGGHRNFPIQRQIGEGGPLPVPAGATQAMDLPG